MVSFLDERGKQEREFVRFTVSKMDPHTTQKKGRSCEDCHLDSRSLGLGTGSISLKSGQWEFTPAMKLAGTPFKQATDSFVDIAGKPLVNTSRPGLRPFNGEELDRILYVGQCLPCHRDFKDPVMQNWKPHGKQTACNYFNFH